MGLKGVTSLGKKLRKIRIDHDEITLDMAKKLEISVSYLSAIENGKRAIPTNFLEKICEKYGLDNTMRNELEKDIIKHSGEVIVNVKNLSDTQQELSILYARKVNELSDEQITKIRGFLIGKDE